MKKRWGCVGIILLLLLCVSGLLNLILIASGMHKLQRFGEEVVAEGSGKNPDKIALINLRGLISSSIEGSQGETMVDDIKIALRQALDDEKVKAIVLNIDSPGGEVTASDVIYNAVRKARMKKPVVIYMGSLAASGGYYVSCGGSYLMASDTTFTGSIGVIIESVNFSKLMDKIGLSPVVIKSGSFKDMLSPERDMTDDERKYIQGMVDETYGKFVQIVADERKLDVNKLRNGIADGRVISGKDALADGLIDGLGEIEDAFAKARELGNAPGAEVVEYTSSGLQKFLRASAESSRSAQSKIEINLTQKLMPQLEPGRLYLLPDFYAQ